MHLLQVASLHEVDAHRHAVLIQPHERPAQHMDMAPGRALYCAHAGRVVAADECMCVCVCRLRAVPATPVKFGAQQFLGHGFWPCTSNAAGSQDF